MSATTAYSSAPLLLDVLLISPAILLLLLAKPDDAPKKPSKLAPATNQHVSEPEKADPIPVRSFLTFYRGAMMIVTCLAILAVDFPIFPRRFAKAENWGTSLMDLGVGSFVFSAGVVAARSILKPRSSTHRTSFSARFLISIRHSIPLLALGLIRLYSVKGLDYAEHVTEYGVHWNFFFTFAFLPPFVEIADLIITTTRIPLDSSNELLALIFALAYEIVLDTTELKRFILVSPRLPDSTLLVKNREGIFSFIGYLSIFLAGRGSGLVVLSPSAPIPKSTKAIAADQHAWRERALLMRRLATRSVIWIAVYMLSSNYAVAGLNVSRRLANLPYVVWVMAFNNTQILMFCLVETICFPSAYKTADAGTETSSRVMQAFNSNGLVIFLVANLLTGLVNLTLKTLDMSDLASMGVLIAYAVTVTGVALGMQRLGMKIKL